ncbi:MAG: complex I subunit 5 family protein [Bacillota bacterium]
MDTMPVIIIFLPLLTSIVIYIFNNKKANILAFISQFLLAAVTFLYYFKFRSMDAHKVRIGGWDQFIGITLKNDSISVSFMLLSVFIWLIIIIYSWNKHKDDTRFYFFLLMQEGCFLGVLQTNDLFNFFLFLELITIISTILILYKKDGYSIRAGLFYMLFNTTGMLFFLIGIIFIYVVTGTLNMEVASYKLLAIKDFQLVKLAYIFMMSAVGVKSAFFPVFNWLPKAHGAAPAAISALLSGLLVKSGLYGFIRLNQMFDIRDYMDFFIIVGFITAICGVIFALCQKDIKQILAFHTISQVGLILIGLSTMEGMQFYGGLLHIFNHAIFKTLLFLCVGSIISVYDKRRISEIRGVFKRMPYLSIFMIIGMLSITGSPLFNGFVSKSIIKYSLDTHALIDIMINIINIGTAASFIKFSQIFAGHSEAAYPDENRNNISHLLLSAGCVIMGTFYAPIIKELWHVDVYHIKLFTFDKWLLYFITLLLGLIIYKTVVEKDYKIIRDIRHLNISFESSNIMLILFISIMILWGRFVIL